MAERLRPSLRLRFLLEPVPPSLGTTEYRWSHEALADALFTEGRIQLDGWGDVEYALSGMDGHYEGTALDFTLNDDDGLIGGLLGEEATQFFLQREATLELLSVAGRAADLDWRQIINGKIADWQAGSGRTQHGVMRDMLSAEFSTLNLDRPVLRHRVALSEHPDCPKTMLGSFYPIIVGRHTDAGTIDANGEPAEIGCLPLHFLGFKAITDEAPATPGPGVTWLGPPQNLVGEVVGAGGLETYWYAVAAITDRGETVASATVEVNGCPDYRNATASNYVRLTWDPPIDAGDMVIAYRVLGRRSNVPNRWIQGCTNNETYVDPETEFHDNTFDRPTRLSSPSVEEKAPVTPVVSSAPIVDPATPLEGGLGKMLVGLGALRPTAIYVSDTGGTGDTRAPPKRFKYPLNGFGVIAPFLEDGSTNPDWPHATPYVEVNGIRQTWIYLYGRVLQDHIEGKVTAAVNCCGYDASGAQDGGATVDQAGPALALMLNEFFLKDHGRGYEGGAFGPLEEFQDGTPILRTSSFDDFQDLSIGWIGGDGYKAAWVVDDPQVTWRGFLQWFNLTFGSYIGAGDVGQIQLVGLDDTGDLTAAIPMREHIEILDVELPPAQAAHAEIQHRRPYQCHWMPDSQKWRNPQHVVIDTPARDANKSTYIDSSVIDCRCTNDPVAAADAQARQLIRRTTAPIYQTWTTGMNGLECPLGAIVLLTHRGGGRGGYIEAPFFVIRRRYNPNTSEVIVTGLSIARLLATGIGGLEDEAVMNPNLGDETLFDDALTLR